VEGGFEEGFHVGMEGVVVWRFLELSGMDWFVFVSVCVGLGIAVIVAIAIAVIFVALF